jgi:hypothetical protein
MRTVRREWLLVLISVAFGLLLFEGLLRGYYGWQGKVPPHPDASVHEEWQWANDHLQAGSADLPGLAQYHPALGWVVREDIDAWLQDKTAGMRIRDIREPRSPGTHRMLLVGDSYTFGLHVDNEQAFATVLQREFLPDWEILNLGVSGYGPGQMLLLYEQIGVRYQPDIVILGFYVRDFFRMLKHFDRYAKPRFRLADNGGLELTNIPVIAPAALYEEYANGKRRIGGWGYSYLYGAAGANIARLKANARMDNADHPSWQLMAAILRRFRDRVLAAGGRPFLLIFPTRPEKYRDTVNEDIDRLAQSEASRLGIPHLSLAQPFLSEQTRHPNPSLFRDRKLGGHLSVRGNELVAQLLYRQLRHQGLLTDPVR